MTDHYRTMDAFTDELLLAVERHGYTLRVDRAYMNTGTFTIADPQHPLGPAVASITFAFQETYASFSSEQCFDEELRPRRPWHSAKYAAGDLQLVMDFITAYLGARNEQFRVRA